MLSTINRIMKKSNIDPWLIGAVLILVLIGTVMIYSASSAWAQAKFVDASFFFRRQVVRVIVGLGLMCLVMKIDYHWYRSRPFFVPFFFGALGLLIYVILSNDIQEIRGSARWISISDLSLQPSEYMKYALILYMADAIERKQSRLDSFWNGYVPLVSVLVISEILILLEPDLGTAITIGMIVFCMFFVGRVKIWHLTVSLVLALATVYVTVKTTPYQLRRVLVYLNPDIDPLGGGYQIKQSLISLGNGGILGQGLGKSTQKLLYLPEPYTDFIFSILGEELGFIGTLLVTALFLIILWRGIKIARNAPDMFGSLLTVGLVSSIVICAMTNIAVVINLIPTTGLPLPFISYGGNSLLFSLMGAGIIFNISSRTVPDELMPKTPPFIVAQLRKEGKRFQFN